MGTKNWEQQQKWLQKINIFFCLEPMLDKDREKEENNRLRNQKIKNRKEVIKVVIAAQQSITHNRWRGFGAIFNSPIAYQVLQLVEEEVVVIVAQMDVEEVIESTSDGIQQFTQMGSPNENQELIEKLIKYIVIEYTRNYYQHIGTID